MTLSASHRHSMLASIIVCICLFLAPDPCHAIKARAGDREVTVSWIAPTRNEDTTPLTDLKGYYIYRAEEGSEVFTKINEDPVRGVHYTDTGLTNGLTYCYYVTAVDYTGNESKRSPERFATPNILSPARLRAKPGDGEVRLFWEAYTGPSSGEGAKYDYRVYRKAATEKGFSLLTQRPIEETNFIDTEVANGIAYFYKVSCIDPDGFEGLSSEEAGATPRAAIPAEPSSVKATYVHTPDSAGRVDLEWTKMGDEGIAGYRVYRRLRDEREFALLTPEPLPNEAVSSDMVNKITYTDSSALPDKGYLYSIIAVTSKGMESEYVKEVICYTSTHYIASFTEDTGGNARKAGDKICFCLTGEPDAAKAYLELEGLAADLPMKEVKDGVYTACIDVTGDMAIENARATGFLIDAQGNKASMSSEGTVTIDNQPPPPVIVAKATLDRGVVQLSWDAPDDEYSGFEILGKEEEGRKRGNEWSLIKCVTKEKRVCYDTQIRPDRSYIYSVYGLDRAGNKSEPVYTNSLNIPYQPGIPQIEAVKEGTGGIAQRTGDRIFVELSGEWRCKAGFSIPGVSDIPVAMQEQNDRPGYYTGTYIIRPEDKAEEAVIHLCLEDDIGHINCLNSQTPFSVNWGSEDTTPPAILMAGHNAFEGFTDLLVPGNTLEVTLQGKPRCSAAFTILSGDKDPKKITADQDQRLTLFPMKDLEGDPPGHYGGSHTVFWTDQPVAGAYVWVCLSDRAGNRTWTRAEGAFSIDTRTRIKVTPDKNALMADEKSQARITVKVTDAKDNNVEGHPIALTLTTTDEYTGVVGGGGFDEQVGGDVRIDFDKETDSFGEVTATYRAGFAAKTAIIVAKDLITGNAGVGYVLSILEVQTTIKLNPPITKSRLLGTQLRYKLMLTADPYRITADGVSTSWITAQITDMNGKPIEQEGVRVSFFCEGVDGQVLSSQAFTNGGGQASVRFRAGITRGTVTIRGVCNSEDSYEGAEGTVQLALMSDAPAILDLKVADKELTADGRNTTGVSVWVADINRNAVQQASVEFSVESGGGAIADRSRETDINGDVSSVYTTPDLTGESPAVATILVRVTSKAPVMDSDKSEEKELAKAVGTIFVPILFPDMEDDAEVRVIDWLARKGDRIEIGAPLVRLETEKGEVVLKAALSGEFTKISIHRGEKAILGETLGQIIADEEYMETD